MKIKAIATRICCCFLSLVNLVQVSLVHLQANLRTQTTVLGIMINLINSCIILDALQLYNSFQVLKLFLMFSGHNLSRFSKAQVP